MKNEMKSSCSDLNYDWPLEKARQPTDEEVNLNLNKKISVIASTEEC